MLRNAGLSMDINAGQIELISEKHFVTKGMFKFHLVSPNECINGISFFLVILLVVV